MWGCTVTCCRLLFAPLLWCAHPSICLPPHPGCTLPCSHTLPLACMQGHTITLLHPCFGAPTLLFVCSSPALGCAPPCSHALCVRSPCPPAPLACAQRERAHGQGRVHKLGGGHGVVWVEGTMGGHVCGAGAETGG